MGKKETKETYEDTRMRNRKMDLEQSAFRDESANRGTVHNTNISEGRTDLSNRFTNLADGGGYADVNLERLDPNVGTYKGAEPINYQGSQYQGAGSPKDIGYQAIQGPNSLVYEPISSPDRVSYDANKIGKGAYEGLASTGGYDEDRRASIGSQITGLQEFGRTGGLNDESIGRFRGSGVFDEFARTGGYTDTDKANIRARALSPISSFATGTQNELNRRRAVQGGFAPGFDAASQSLRRGAARGIADTSLNAELGIKERVNQGRLTGAQNISQSEGALQGLRTGNMFAGMTGAGNMEMNLQNAINSGMLSGAGGLHQMSLADLQAQGTNAANELQASQFNAGNQLQAGMFNNQQAQNLAARNAENTLRANMFNSGQTQQNNQFNASNQLQNNQFNAGNQLQTGMFNTGEANTAGRFNANAQRGNAVYNSQGQLMTDTGNRNFDRSTRLAGLGGLQDIQQNDINQGRAERDRILNSYNTQYGAQNQAGGQQTALATQPGAFSNIVQGIGGLAGAAAPFFVPGARTAA